jgi:hypothetical protein
LILEKLRVDSGVLATIDEIESILKNKKESLLRVREMAILDAAWSLDGAVLAC